MGSDCSAYYTTEMENGNLRNDGHEKTDFPDY